MLILWTTQKTAIQKEKCCRFPVIRHEVGHGSWSDSGEIKRSFRKYLPEDEHGRRLIHMSDELFAIGAETNGWDVLEKFPFLETIYRNIRVNDSTRDQIVVDL